MKHHLYTGSPDPAVPSSTKPRMDTPEQPLASWPQAGKHGKEITQIDGFFFTKWFIATITRVYASYISVTILYTNYFFGRYFGVSHKWGISNMDGLQMFIVENIIQMDEDIMGM